MRRAAGRVGDARDREIRLGGGASRRLRPLTVAKISTVVVAESDQIGRPLRDNLAGELLDRGLEGLLGVCELKNHKEEWNAEPAELAEIISVLRPLRALRSDFVLR